IMASLFFASSTSAQQPEKRIALVIGNAAYQAEALPTAANDAGLIAQTLQAAGFDVLGARDLDQDTLRRTFRDFLEQRPAPTPSVCLLQRLRSSARRRKLLRPSRCKDCVRYRSPHRGDSNIGLRATAWVAQLKGQRCCPRCGAGAPLCQSRPTIGEWLIVDRARKGPADCVQRRARHGSSAGTGTLWCLRSGACRIDANRWIAAWRSV